MTSGKPAHAPARALPGWIVGAGLLLNLGLAGVLFRAQAATRAALARIEHTVAARQPPETDVLGRGVVDPQERLALLLAASADAEQTRRVLESVSPQECVEITRTLLARPAANDRNAALGATFQRVAAQNPAQALALLGEVPPAGLKSDLAATVAASWLERDPARAATWIAGDGAALLARAAGRRLLASAVDRWAAFDPAAATRFVAAAPHTGLADQQTLRAVSRDWARKDPAAVLAWTRGLPPGDGRKAPATYGALEGWTDLAPAQAAGYVGQLTFGASQGYAGEAAAVASRWTEQEPAAAAQWAAGLPDHAARRDALQQVAATWARADAPAAARWAAGLPASPERAEIWQGVSDLWADADPTGDETWLGTLPTGGDRDAAVAAYTVRVVATDPEKALTWAKSLSTGPFAAQQIQTLLATWAGKDVVAARNWAAANQIAPAGQGGSQ